jgi:hypothetical protein
MRSPQVCKIITPKMECKDPNGTTSNFFIVFYENDCWKTPFIFNKPQDLNTCYLSQLNEFWKSDFENGRRKNLCPQSSDWVFIQHLFWHQLIIYVATLALGSWPKQGLAKVQAKSKARESHFMLLGVWKYGRVWENEPPHSQMDSHFGGWNLNGLPNL